jgi:amino acid adenylation domain-containing protein
MNQTVHAGQPPVPTLAQLFERQAERSPDSIAVSSTAGKISYAELAAQARLAAAGLRDRGVTAGEPVGLCIDRTPEAIVALLGIVFADAAYVPLPLDYPDARLNAMVAAAGIRVVVHVGAGASRARALPGEAVLLAELLDRPGPGSGPGGALPPQSLAYIMFTSGSTGVPKACAIPHAAVARLAAAPEVAPLDGSDVVFCHSPLGFDASTFEIWGALLNGARLHVLTERALPGREFLQAMGECSATVAWMTAALFQECTHHGFGQVGSLRRLIAGGDVLPVPAVNRFVSSWPGIQLVNGYGPTENTTFTCCHPVDEPVAEGDGAPIGAPITGTGAAVLTEDLRPAAAGSAAELFACGDGLAWGYVGAPRATAAAFLPDPAAGAPGGRMYRTGDRVLARADGVLVFRGRQDRQIKVRGGFRVELDEIERTLLGHHRLAAAAVVDLPGEDQHSERRLLAAAVPLEGETVRPFILREYLAARLPAYMVPSIIRVVPALPLNPHGKLDRDALLARTDGRAGIQGEYVEPDGPVERAIADMWEDLLDVEPIGALDEFFAAGGDSLVATRLARRLKESFGYDLSAQAFYAEPTVRAIATVVSPSPANGTPA